MGSYGLRGHWGVCIGRGASGALATVSQPGMRAECTQTLCHDIEGFVKLTWNLTKIEFRHTHTQSVTHTGLLCATLQPLCVQAQRPDTAAAVNTRLLTDKCHALLRTSLVMHSAASKRVCVCVCHGDTDSIFHYCCLSSREIIQQREGEIDLSIW